MLSALLIIAKNHLSPIIPLLQLYAISLQQFVTPETWSRLPRPQSQKTRSRLSQKPGFWRYLVWGKSLFEETRFLLLGKKNDRALIRKRDRSL